MTEQEARAEAARRWPGHRDRDLNSLFGAGREGFIAGAAWERARHSPRAAAPSDTDRRLIDALRRKARFFERPEGEGANETELLLNEAADALSRASQPVQVEVTTEAVTTLAKHMANVASDWDHNDCDDDDHPLEHSNWEAYTDDARRALVALGGGE